MGHALRTSLERYFEFQALGTNWRTEVLAGVTTFLTMAYIVFVQPSIMAEAGVPAGAAMAATCLCAAAGSLLMGFYARYPIALAPGMGINAYFAYTVVKGMGLSWQTALGTVFLAGLAFVLLTLTGVRQLIMSAVPVELHASVAAGIGLFLALSGLQNAGIVVAAPQTMVTLGNLHSPNTLLACFGLLAISALMAWGVRAAMLIGILATTALGGVFGVAQWRPHSLRWSDMTAAALKLDVRSALSIGFLEIVFVFLFVVLFDNIGTLVGVAKKAGLMDAENRIPRVDRILLTDASATILGSVTGTSPVVRSHAVCSPGGGLHPGGCDGSGADRGGQPDGVHGGRNSLVQPRSGHAGFPDDGDHPAHLQHRQRHCDWLHLVHLVEGAPRRRAQRELADLRSRRAVHRAVRVLGQRQVRPCRPPRESVSSATPGTRRRSVRCASIWASAGTRSRKCSISGTGRKTPTSACAPVTATSTSYGTRRTPVTPGAWRPSAAQRVYTEPIRDTGIRF
jgi:AGZA family xanthine/uracil permease-like MFS transporter